MLSRIYFYTSMMSLLLTTIFSYSMQWTNRDHRNPVVGIDYFSHIRFVNHSKTAVRITIRRIILHTTAQKIIQTPVTQGLVEPSGSITFSVPGLRNNPLETEIEGRSEDGDRLFFYVVPDTQPLCLFYGIV